MDKNASSQNAGSMTVHPLLLKKMQNIQRIDEFRHNRRFHSHTILGRIFLLLVSFVLALPGSFFVYVSYLEYQKTGITALLIIPVSIALIFCGGSLFCFASVFKR
jgi:hypothetical protein